MNDLAYKISLDINEHGSQVVLKAKQSDTGRKVHISLRSGGIPYMIAEDCYAVFTATKPDGAILYNACTIEGNEIVYEFTEQTCASVGRLRCEIKLYGMDDKLITSSRFALLVEGEIYPDGRVVSSSEFSALTQMVSDTLAAQVETKKATNNANNAAQEANNSANYASQVGAMASNASQVATAAAKNASEAAVSANEAAVSANEATLAANGAANDANLAAENANDTVTDVVRIVKDIMCVGEVAGESVSLHDAVKFGFIGCRIFGKTTQNGTPTPDAPVDLVSVGDSGSITVNVTGDNDAKSMTIATPNGLPGIPVISGGNYTDANGQQWVCDEIDFARGVYVQRIQEIDEFDAVETLDLNTKYMKRAAYEMLGKLDCPFGLCTHTNAYNYHSLDTTHFYIDLRDAWVYLPTGSDVSNLKVYAILTNPIEIPLSEEEIAAFNALHTYRGNTTISNDASALMEIEYVMDAKKYIDRLISAGMPWLTWISVPASNWEGADGLYSQVVGIDGVTEYSKVDLLPSVEQLAIFHSKDVAFVTENEGGVVTVYAIGDKPTSDYTIQAQITEVAV